MAERRRPVRFFHYSIEREGVLWLNDDTVVETVYWNPETDGFDVVIYEYGEPIDWPPPEESNAPS